jgi:DNA repair protein RadA/Sms
MRSKLDAKTNFVCQSCGFESPKWLGKCPSCGGWNTFVEERARADLRTSARAKGKGARDKGGASVKAVTLAEIDLDRQPRMMTGISEFDSCLGGGILPGSLILLGGDPGIGKSTLALQVMERIADSGKTVLYVSGEESLEQIKLRAQRLGAGSENLLLASLTDLDDILELTNKASPALLVVDSIQTMYWPQLESAPGSVGQVRECGAMLMRHSKEQAVATLLVGHVTKEGVIAGPRTLEHMVDTVLYMEGERHHSFRILRSVKNRFGSTNEIGVFEMRESGLAEVANPSEVFLSERNREVPGSAVVCALEGTRPVLVEIQALVSPTAFGTPQRNTTGLNHRRLSLLLAVLERRAGLSLGMQDVFVNIAGGLKIEEPAIDLGVAVAIASAFRNRPADPRAVFIGEVGLGGEIRSVSQTDRRVAEARKLGFTRVVCPAKGIERGSLGGMEPSTVSTISQALERAIV